MTALGFSPTPAIASDAMSFILSPRDAPSQTLNKYKSMFNLSPLKILPTRGATQKCLFPSRTPDLQLSWFSLLTSIFGFVNVLFITQTHEKYNSCPRFMRAVRWAALPT